MFCWSKPDRDSVIAFLSAQQNPSLTINLLETVCANFGIAAQVDVKCWSEKNIWFQSHSLPTFRRNWLPRPL